MTKTKTITKTSLVNLNRLTQKYYAGRNDAHQALLEIYTTKCWKATHKTFDQFCVETLEFKSRARVYQIIDAEQTKARLSTIVDNLPTKESHLRVISKVPKAKQAKIVATVIEQCEHEQREPTAKDYRRAAKPHLPPAETKPLPPKSAPPDKTKSWKDQRFVASQHAKYLMRAIDDLNDLKTDRSRDAAIAATHTIIGLLKNWG